jgi:carbonic anhydrase
VGLRDEVVAANRRFAQDFRLAHLPRSPRRGLAVVTCMDARIAPIESLGLEVGDANVLRNAGAVVTPDVLRSLAIARAALGVDRAYVIGHTDCGLEGWRNEALRARVGAAAADLDFLAFDRVEESVRASVLEIRRSPLLPASFRARGWVYDVRTGRLNEVT